MDYNDLEDWQYKHICFIYDNNDNCIGFTHTRKEADELCKLNVELYWDYNKIKNKNKLIEYIKNRPLLFA